MIDKQYFDRDLPRQHRQIGEWARFEIHLQSGARLDVFRVDAARDGYVLLTVLPSEELESVDEAALDRIAVPYAQISHVSLTRAPAGSSGSLHFRLRGSPDEPL